MKTSDVRSTVHFVRAAALPSSTRLSRLGCSKCSCKSLEAQLAQRQLRRRAGNLAITLMTVLHIEPTGRLLVSVCGTGKETDNAEAVLHWICQYIKSSTNIGENSFHEVKNAFLRFLISATGQEYVE